MVLQYAYQIARSSLQRITEKNRKQSFVLVTHLFGMEDVTNCEFLHAIRNIAFVPPAQVNKKMEQLYPQYGQRNHQGHLSFISFQGSIINSSMNVVWTSQNILPSFANPRVYFPGTENKFISDTLFCQVKIDTDPTPRIVAKDATFLCFQLESILSNRQTHMCHVDINTLRTVLRSIYSVLYTI